MKIKNKIVYLTAASIVLFLNSCNSNKKDKSEKQIEIRDSIENISKGLLKEPEKVKKDTLSVQDRMSGNGKFHSHIQLDFAKAENHIKDTSQVKLIDVVCAVSVLPDTLWINKMQKEIGEDWREIASDNNYYNHLAKDTLKKLDIPTFYARRDKRFIRFVKADNSNFIIDLSKMKDAWGLILFNKMDNPVFWSSTDIDSEIKEIFNK